MVSYLGNRKWLCQCSCGIEKICFSYNLISGDTRSCGCAKRERDSDLNARFWNKIEKMKNDGCWLWIGNKTRGGYGSFTLNRKRLLAHRFSYSLACGNIPEGLCVCHTCDVRLCVNPSHLFLGTIADNIHDMVSKGRNARGESVAGSRLTPELVSLIRYVYSSGEKTLDEIAKEFGLNSDYVSRIVSGKAWKHIAFSVSKPCRGFHHRGEKSSSSKLTWEKVRLIRDKYRSGLLQKEIADEFGISQTAVSDIVRGATWKES